jgi:hypothetical protein
MPRVQRPRAWTSGGARVGSALGRLGLTRRDLLAFAFFLGVTVLWFHELFADLDNSVLVGPNDASASIRAYWGAAYLGENPFTLERDPLNGAPEGLRWSRAVQYANALVPGPIWLLHYVAGFGGAANLYLLAGFVLTGFSVYLLLDRFGFHPVGSLVAGFAVAFNPWMIERAYAGHAGFMHAWVFVALIAALLHQYRRRTVLSAVLVGLATVLTFYQGSYFGLLGVLVVGVFLVVDFIRRRSWAERLWLFTLADIAIVAMLVAFLPALVAWHYDREVVAAVVSNSVESLQDLGAAPQSYVLPSVRHPILGNVTEAFDEEAGQHWSENTLYLGWSLIALGVAGIVLVLRRHRDTLATPLRRYFLVCMVVLAPAAFLFSLKPRTTVLGVDVPMPSYLFGEYTTFWRVFARFGLLVTFALAVLAAFALTVLIRRYRHGLAVAGAACALLVFEYFSGFAPAYSFSNPGPWVDWLERQPRGTVAHYPLPTDQSLGAPALELLARTYYLQRDYRQPIFAVFGSGYGGTREEAIRLLGRYVEDPLTPGILKAEGVRYVLLHDDVYREEGKSPPAVPPGFRQVARLGDVRALVLDDSVQPVDVDATLEQNAAALALTQGLPAPEVEVTGAEARLSWEDLRLRRVSLAAVVSSPKAPSTLEAVGEDGAVVGRVPIGTEPTPVSLGPMSVDDGSERLTFRTAEGNDVRVDQLTAQPLADFSNSLRG